MQSMSSLAPLPLQPVPSPPWSNYNTRVSILRSMKKKHGHMDEELYPPGQNPGYFNPWVTMPYPTIPAPNTPQYGGPWPTAMPRKEMPQLQQGGWVQVQLNNKIDTERNNLSDQLQDANLKSYYARVDGWFLCFYEATQTSVGRRVSSIDLRLVRRTQTASGIFGSRVILIMEAGTFEFVTNSQEAENWCATITSIMLAWSQSQSKPPSLPTETAASRLAPRVHQEFSLSRQQLAPLQRHLRGSWAACVKAVSQGCPAPADAFEEVFLLYDSDGNESLCFSEIRRMFMDLIQTRKVEVEEALSKLQLSSHNLNALDFKTQSQLKDAARNASILGKELLADYTARLSNQGFETRCLLLQSQLDLSADQRVALVEFLSAAPRVLLPESELKQEANFYRSVSFVLKLVQKAEFFSTGGDTEGDDSGICVHQ